MRSIPTLFFAAAGLFALAGMAWGIQMSASHDHSLSPAHGHLNLIGFVAMSVFGSYYALTPAAAASRLAAAHFAIAVLAVLVITPGIVLAITGRTEALAKVGSVLAILTMALFVVTVLRHGAGSGQVRGAAHPAE